MKKLFGVLCAISSVSTAFADIYLTPGTSITSVDYSHLGQAVYCGGGSAAPQPAPQPRDYQTQRNFEFTEPSTSDVVHSYCDRNNGSLYQKAVQLANDPRANCDGNVLVDFNFSNYFCSTTNTRRGNFCTCSALITANCRR